MSEKGWYVFFGLLTAIIVGILVLPDEAEQTFNSIGDFMYNLTTSEDGRISTLQPEVQTQLRTLLYALNEQGMRVHVGQTLRTPSQEKSVIDAGKSAVKTHSWHELGRAVDLYPINPDTGQPDYAGARDDLFLKMHQVADSLGWRGIAYNDDGTRRYITNSSGHKIWDGGHVEWRSPYDTIAEAVDAEGSQYGIA